MGMLLEVELVNKREGIVVRKICLLAKARVDELQSLSFRVLAVHLLPERREHFCGGSALESGRGESEHNAR